MTRPAPTAGEVAWSGWLAKQMGGIAEFRLPGGSRVDILTPSLAIEVDWLKKWPEAIGQALYYGLETDRQGAVLLLLRGKPNDPKYLSRAKLATDRAGIALLTWHTMGAAQ